MSHQVCDTFTKRKWSYKYFKVIIHCRCEFVLGETSLKEETQCSSILLNTPLIIVSIHIFKTVLVLPLSCTSATAIILKGKKTSFLAGRFWNLDIHYLVSISIYCLLLSNWVNKTFLSPSFGHQELLYAVLFSYALHFTLVFQH